jgi:general secretion pathway protein F
MLLHLADLADKATQRKIDRAMTLLGPVLTVVIGMVVGGLIISVMQAVLNVNELVLR